jgi:MOSC domain-containing protein YiiM
MKDDMEEKGRVLSLNLSRKEDGQRVSSEELLVDMQGVRGDKFYGKDPQRSILITALGSYAMAEAEGIKISYGSLGENILVDYNLYHLAPGTIFEIGDAVLEITQNCTLCKSLSKVDSKLPKLLKNDRGFFAKVVKEGSIRINDPIRIGIKQ